MRLKKIYLLLFPGLMFLQKSSAQKVNNIPGTNTGELLSPVNVVSYRPSFIDALPDVRKTYLYAGKRSETIRVSETDLNIPGKVGRQLFARIPGIFVYDMDGTGNQLNISARGLDPHRSWEMNSRQNGVIINSDLYGYPASHYSPPLESIATVELVRGTASLQYGPQFGGMINYVTRQSDTTKHVNFESISSAGSFGHMSSYLSIGGRVGKWTYHLYDYKRKADGYRQNSSTKASAQLLSIQYKANEKLSIKTELGRSVYQYQIPGPLSDSMFKVDPRQSTRGRNYFRPDIWIPSLQVEWKISKNTFLSFINSAVLGKRESVQFDAAANVRDTIDLRTAQYKNRQVDIDNFNSFTTELRINQSYNLKNVGVNTVAGIQLLNNDLHRRQLGKGTTGLDFDLSVENGFTRDLHLLTKNFAVFLENQLKVSNSFVISPGVRFEYGRSDMRGNIAYYDDSRLPASIDHKFVLLGINGQYRINQQLKIYGGWSQAFRPVLFKDIIPGSEYETIDNNLRDGKGYNAELGLNGNWSGLHINVSLFDLMYRNRMGTVITETAAGKTQVLRTNTGDSRNSGIELLAEGSIICVSGLTFGWFSSSSFIHARYKNGLIAAGSENKEIRGNRVESVPVFTIRTGISAAFSKFRASLQYSYVGKTYSDALNTRIAASNGVRGPVPAYSVWDLNGSWQLSKQLSFRANVNNLLNRSYFTKRPSFYPGPGVWPSDGRGLMVSAALKL